MVATLDCCTYAAVIALSGRSVLCQVVSNEQRQQEMESVERAELVDTGRQYECCIRQLAPGSTGCGWATAIPGRCRVAAQL